MNRLLRFALWALVCLAGPALAPAAAEVIRLKAPTPATSGAAVEEVQIGAAKRGFDYEAFEARLESLWFQRKTFLASGRDTDADLQLEKIRAFCAEEGVKRLGALSGALLIEAHRFREEGSYERALVVLRFAEAFDPGRPQTRVARASIYWKSGRGTVVTLLELLAGARAALLGSGQDLSLLHQSAFLVGVSLLITGVVFALLMVWRHQVALRHEVEEWVGQFAASGWPRVAGWAALGLPLLIWIGAGWAALYWLIVTFRFMNRGERLATTLLLVAGIMTVPAYHVAVALYGMAADPAVRTTLASLRGNYDPDRVVKLQRLVRTYPDDPVYRFLLAGLYKSGQYYEEAFAEYKQVLNTHPDLAPAYINVGNIFYTTGQHAEAIANYRRAIELSPDAFLAWFNMHLAQSEDFRFAEAEESLRSARRIDGDRVSDLLASASGWGDRPSVHRADLNITSVWDSALSGRRPLQLDGTEESVTGRGWTARAVNPIAITAVAGLAACLLLMVAFRDVPTARRCIRCGNPFCHHCKSGREAQEYCSQCMHLFVLGDGLAPGTKARKLYEVERHARLASRGRSLVSALLPGSAQILRGRTGRGFLLLLMWCVAVLAARSSLLPLLGGSAGITLRPELITGVSNVPAMFQTNPVAWVGFLAVPLVWLMGNAWRRRGREI